MRLKVGIEQRKLVFHKPAGTSRGVYHTHDVWYVRLWNPDEPGFSGVGECAPLPDLSCDADPEYSHRLRQAVLHFEEHDFDVSKCIITDKYPGLLKQWMEVLSTPFFVNNPSIRFGFESALYDLFSDQHRLFDTSFSKSLCGIPINGLIWMGTYREMSQQIREKLTRGFHCIKLKIGAIDFEQELNLLSKIRSEYSENELILRVDANGAFQPGDVKYKLDQLAALHLHSIEQPLRAGQLEILKALCLDSPLPIALDEELIGRNTTAEKKELLDVVNPPYLVLKPTLHGGIIGCEEWITLAEERGIKWWITSALESNIGLNAVAQWTATKSVGMHQGLGTGMLYENNVPMPLSVEGEHLWFRPK